MSAAVGDWRARARELRAADPGRSNASIGRELGVRRDQVWKALHPEGAQAMDRRSNAKRGAAKRAWGREHDRGTCEECGAWTRAGAARHGVRLCRSCYDRQRGARRMAKARVIERMWADGASMNEIADRLGTTVGTIEVEMVRLRREGLADLPYRRRPRAGRPG